jgi:hypothetical protein
MQNYFRNSPFGCMTKTVPILVVFIVVPPGRSGTRQVLPIWKGNLFGIITVVDVMWLIAWLTIRVKWRMMIFLTIRPSLYLYYVVNNAGIYVSQWRSPKNILLCFCQCRMNFINEQEKIGRRSVWYERKSFFLAKFKDNLIWSWRLDTLISSN